MNRQKIVLVAHNIRSCHNVGSLMRTAEGLGAEHLYLSGYTPFPQTKNDKRLPHISAKLTRQIHKTALGAENSLKWSHHTQLAEVRQLLQPAGYRIAALEQTPQAVGLDDYAPISNVALLVGNERHGLDADSLKLADDFLYIPMAGKKESFNVVIAAAIGLYHLTSLQAK